MSPGIHQHRHRESAALSALIVLGKSLAESLRFWISTGQVQANERTFASGQLADFDAAWKEYGEIRTAASDRMSKLKRRKELTQPKGTR